MSFFMVRNGQFLRDGKASHSPCIWMSARPIHGVAFLACWFTLKGVCYCCEEIWSKRKRVFEDDVFIENTRLVGGSKTQDLNLSAGLVLNMSHGPPGQWFPETEYWASAIFVGTSGIPPKIIYRSVKSYNMTLNNLMARLQLCWSFWETQSTPSLPFFQVHFGPQWEHIIGSYQWVQWNYLTFKLSETIDLYYRNFYLVNKIGHWQQ